MSANIALVGMSALLAGHSQVSANMAASRMDDALIAICKLTQETGVSNPETLVVQFYPETDEKLQNNEIRFIDPKKVLSGLYPQAILVSSGRFVVLFSKTVALPVKRESDIVTLSLTNLEDGSNGYQAALYSSNFNDNEDAHNRIGRCTIGKPKGSSNLMFERLTRSLMPSSPESVQ